MSDNFTRISFKKIFDVENIITIFYMELSKNFWHAGEKHNFWEMVYIDKGEMICTADKNRFLLKSGEMTFHKPNEFHNLSGDNTIASNVSILTFECKSDAMKNLEGKIFRLDAEEKSMLSTLFSEGMSCFKLKDKNNPLLQNLEEIPNAPKGSSQMTKNLLEIFLIKLSRNSDTVTKKMRRSYLIDGFDVPFQVKEILDYLNNNIYGKVSIAGIAKSVGRSESSIKRLFQQYMKNGIINYYISLKIKEAKKLIGEDKYNMTQIADLLAFDTPQYFSKCFKKHTNMTPSEYKKHLQHLDNYHI